MKLGRATKFGIAASIAAVARSTTASKPRFTPSTLLRTNYPRVTLGRSFSASQHRAMSSPPSEIKPAPITIAEYHKLADTYLDAVLNQYEEKQDDVGDIDVEFSVRISYSCYV